MIIWSSAIAQNIDCQCGRFENLPYMVFGSSCLSEAGACGAETSRPGSRSKMGMGDANVPKARPYE